MSVDRPAREAMRASAAVTVVLPTPPFPATMTRRDWVQNPAGSTHPPRRRPIRRLVIACLALGLLAGVPSAAAAAAKPRVVDVIEVSGRLDPVEVDFVKHALRRAADRHADALVIQLNSPGALVGDSALDVLVF